MNDQPQPSMVNRSPLVRCFRWLTSWRGVRRSLIVLAWTAPALEDTAVQYALYPRLLDAGHRPAAPLKLGH